MQPIKEAAAEEREAKEFTILQLIPALPGWGAVWGTREEPAQGEPDTLPSLPCAWPWWKQLMATAL
ncbi:MAG: hypothetical protein ACXWPS_02715 [Ktedonobacteraceae bacterium]